MTSPDTFKLIDATIERETEKAALIDVTIDTPVGQRGRKVWFPKSTLQIAENEIRAAAWIVARKAEEIAQDIRMPVYGILTAR